MHFFVPHQMVQKNQSQYHATSKSDATNHFLERCYSHWELIFAG